MLSCEQDQVSQRALINKSQFLLQAPLILGLVLAPLAENRLFLSVDSYGFARLSRLGILLLILLVLVGAFYPILRRGWQKRKDKGMKHPSTQERILGA